MLSDVYRGMGLGVSAGGGDWDSEARLQWADGSGLGISHEQGTR